MSAPDPNRRRSPRTSRGLAVRIVVAAGVALGGVVLMFSVSVLLVTGPGLLATGLGGVPALPAYRLELSGDTEPHRSPPGAEFVVTREMLTVLLRPLEPVVGPVRVRAFVEQGDHSRAWAVPFERSEAGVFLLRAPVRSLPVLGPGRWRLTFLVGRPWALPPGPGAARGRDPGEDWYLLEGELEIVAT